MKTKLVRQIRFTDKQKADNYVDLIQDYDGGKEVPVTLALHAKDDKSTTEYKLTMTVNTDTSVVKLGGTMDVNDNGQKESATMDLTVTPTDKTQTITRPTGAKSFLELVGDVQGSVQDLTGGGVQPKLQ